MNKSEFSTAVRLQTRNDLIEIKEKVKRLNAVRYSDDPDAKAEGKVKYHLMLCFGTGCLSSGAREVKRELETALLNADLESEVEMVETGCNGFCAGGPIVVVYPGSIFYHKVSPGDAKEIVESHLKKGVPVERLMYKDPHNGKIIPKFKDIQFFGLQNARVLHNKGLIDAESLEEYISRDGYFGLYKALNEMTPAQIIEEVKTAGLRGRGGAGFPTGVKWQLCAAQESDVKYIICNADEGDPGAFMDRSLIEADPYAVIEGMTIGARAIGASVGYIYCRAEYPLALDRLNHAIAECRAKGLLGKNIFNTGFDFDIRISQGSGAFVCGEETALMRSIEGKRGEPRPRPPFPAQKGLWDKPSVLNNVETFGNVPVLIHNGADWFKAVGTEKSPGTKIFAVTGKINNVGLVEVNMGIPLGDIVYDIGGGIPGGKEFKAVQIGGPSGGCIPKQHLNTPVDYESIVELGAIIGSGGLIVMDEDSCMVDMARFFLEFIQEESCGKCVPCRVGTKRMLEILERICDGKGEEGDIERLIDLGTEIKQSALCGLGQTAPNPVLSTIRFFRHEYEEHIKEKHCAAGVCPSLVRAPCQSACPAGVDVPGFVSLVGEKRYAEALKLHRERNPFAAVCARVCFHTCEDKCRRVTIDEPLSIRGVKRFMVDQEIMVQVPEIRENKENEKHKIAIIGAGPSGLSCAYFLARLGYKPKVFESEPRPGGMLTQAIPAYRLPRETLAREIRMIESMGVDIVTNKKLGQDFTLDELREEGYEAVFMATGAPESIALDVPGEDAYGVEQAVPFLKQYNIRGSVPVGKKVIVIGGGNAAVDAARTALRLGAEDVTIIYRRTREEMPAYNEEIEEALHEGVKLECLIQPVEIAKDESGRVQSVKCLHMALGNFDRTGRRSPTREEGHKARVFAADQIIVAIGQKLDTEKLFRNQPVKLNDRRFIQIEKLSGQTSIPWVFAGGDAVSGPSSVVKAISQGEIAAVGMDKFLSGEEHAFWRQEKPNTTHFDPDADPSLEPREKPKTIDVERRRFNFDEVELAWTEAVAVKQCQRCLRCDYGKTPAAAGKEA